MGTTPEPPPALEPAAHKGSAGRVLCVCGSAEMPGAAVLTVRAAQRAGAGLVTLTVFAPEVYGVVPAASPETIYLDLSRSRDLFVGRLPPEIRAHVHDARVAGPGLGRSGRARELVRRLVEDGFAGPLVLDADGLNHVAPTPEVCAGHAGALVLTPHPGEAARLLERGVPESDEGRAECARELCERARAIVVLKGRRTVVTDGERTYVNETGNPGMATAGSGDVLSGILGAYLAACARHADEWSAFDAACAAVYAHGLAGDLAAATKGTRGLIASDLVDFLPAAQLRHQTLHAEP